MLETTRISAVKPAWTDNELMQAIDLRRKGLSYAEIGKLVGNVAETTVAKRIKRALVSLDIAIPNFVAVVPKLISRTVRYEPDHLKTELEHRQEARHRRSLSGSLCGDPPPGFSALDGKVGMT